MSITSLLNRYACPSRVSCARNGRWKVGSYARPKEVSVPSCATMKATKIQMCAMPAARSGFAGMRFCPKPYSISFSVRVRGSSQRTSLRAKSSGRMR